jgi:hypothetical protein
VARVVPLIRTYRPVAPRAVLSSSPPLPPVTERTVVQVVPLVEVWIWYADPYAASQVNFTRSIATDWPRSTWIHCGSANALLHRVVSEPSTAPAAALPPSTLDAVTGRFSARLLPTGGWVPPEVKVKSSMSNSEPVAAPVNTR